MTWRIQKTLAFRSVEVYRSLCRLWGNPQYRSGPDLPFRLLSMAGKKHLDLLNQCLISIHQNWEGRPPLRLYSDGTVSVEEMQDKFSWWKGPVNWGSQEDILNWVKQTGSEALLRFAEKEAVGRKLACILKEGAESGVLWCDTDILWYKPFPEVKSDKPLTLKTSMDYQAAYEQGLYAHAEECLSAPPYINTGLVYLKGNLLGEPRLQQWLSRIADSPNHFTEQTFLAIAIKVLKEDIWSLEEIACFQSDKYELKPSFPGKPWLARHYVGPVRHIFWKDAFFNRLNSTK